MERSNHGYETEVDEALSGVVVACLSGPPGGSSVERDRWLASLHGMLEASEAPLTADEAARLLGMCARTLQRHLRRHGTTFTRESKAVRGKKNLRHRPRVVSMQHEGGQGHPQSRLLMLRSES
jgi:methylphosphotriester-DNA--protein-cysteine methyltransferase